MPQLLTHLHIGEISLVDNPSCAETDPVTGQKIPRARVAIRKRDDQHASAKRHLSRSELERRMDEIEVEKTFGKDDPGSQSVALPESEFSRTPPVQGDGKRKRKKMKCKKIIKSIMGAVQKSDNMTRGMIEKEVRSASVLVAKRDGLDVTDHSDRRLDAYEAKIWAKGGIELQQMYDLAKVGAAKETDRGTMQATRSEALLDQAARKLMKQSGMDFTEAFGMVLQQRPDLYQSYEAERANGQVFEVPDSPEYRGFVGDSVGLKRGKGADSRWQSVAGDLDGDDDGDDDGKVGNGMAGTMHDRR